MAMTIEELRTERKRRVAMVKSTLRKAGLTVAKLERLSCCPSQRVPRGGDFEVKAPGHDYNLDLSVRVYFVCGFRVFGQDREDGQKTAKLHSAAAALKCFDFVTVEQ